MSYDHGLSAAQRDYDAREAPEDCYHCKACGAEITEDEHDAHGVCEECIDEWMERQKESGDD